MYCTRIVRWDENIKLLLEHYISNHRKLLLRYVFGIEWYFWLLKTETNILRKKTDLDSWQITSGVQHLVCIALGLYVEMKI
jgi:hypothetical protein